MDKQFRLWLGSSTFFAPFRFLFVDFSISLSVPVAGDSNNYLLFKLQGNRRGGSVRFLRSNSAGLLTSLGGRFSNDQNQLSYFAEMCDTYSSLPVSTLLQIRRLFSHLFVRTYIKYTPTRIVRVKMWSHQCEKVTSPPSPSRHRKKAITASGIYLRSS